ncbi:MAG: N-formylglutamate amidohydrolase [Pseudomonadota bacterium]
MPTHHVEGVLEVIGPEAHQAPLVVDSPHSGTIYPPDNLMIVPQEVLTSGTDLYVHELFASCVNHGATLLHALFPRMYIDPNRAADDLDPSLIDGTWPGKLRPTEKSESGFGLMRRLALPNVPVYERPLPVAEIQMRLDRYYWPYHRTLSTLLDEHQDRFGAVWHLDCHSMKPVGNAMNTDAGEPRPDVVLGNRHGQSCSADFTAFVTERFEAEGLTIALNQPYAGAELTEAYSNPDTGRHSLQIELNRGLYLDDKTYERSSGFDALVGAIDRVCEAIADYALASARSR